MHADKRRCIVRSRMFRHVPGARREPAADPSAHSIGVHRRFESCSSDLARVNPISRERQKDETMIRHPN
jgi:hypothetical protein